MFFRSRNTTRKGQVRCIIFREDEIWYGVVLEFNIVVDAESKFEAFRKLDLAILSYVEAAKNHRIRESVLNQNTSSEYSRLWKDLNEGKDPTLQKIGEKETERPSLEVAFFGFQPQPA